MKKRLLSIVAMIMAVTGIYAQVTLPAGLTTEQWYMEYSMTTSYGDEADNETVEMAFSGSDIYLNMPNPLNGKAWIKGTIANGKATFPIQKIGEYNSATIYVAGSTGKDVSDCVFSYDAEKGTLNLDGYMILNQSTTELSMLGYFTKIVIKRDAPEVFEPVVAPEGLQTEVYNFSASHVFLEDIDRETGKPIYGTEKVNYNVYIGINGGEAYIKGLCQELPEAWLKGTVDAENGSITIPSAQFYGSVKYNGRNINYFFAAANYPTTAPTWADAIVFAKEGDTYTANLIVTINSEARTMSPYDLFAEGKMTKMSDVAATPKAPSFTFYSPYKAEADYGYFGMIIPLESTNNEPLLEQKLSYSVFTRKGDAEGIYTFTPNVYESLSAPMTVVPYTYDDGFDIYRGGSSIFFYQDIADIDALGVQSIYTGGGEEHKSPVVWIDVKAATGIHSATSSSSSSLAGEVIAVRDLTGRRVSSDSKGLVLQTVRQTDGSVKTMKRVRK